MVKNSSYGALRGWLGRGVLIFAALTFGGCGDIHERADFTSMVMGKSGDEVISKVGKPAAVDASNPARVVWTFKRATFDLANANREDGKAEVILEPAGSKGPMTVAEVKFIR